MTRASLSTCIYNEQLPIMQPVTPQAIKLPPGYLRAYKASWHCEGSRHQCILADLDKSMKCNDQSGQLYNAWYNFTTVARR